MSSQVPFAGSNSTEDLGSCLDLYDINPDMYAEHRLKLVERMKTEEFLPKNSIALFQGGESPTRYESDNEPVFRQESSFAYLFGVKEPDVYGVIELDTGKSTLFFPMLPESYAIIMGEVRDEKSFEKEYQVNVKFSQDMVDYIKAIDPTVIYTTRGYNADSGRYAKEATFDGIEQFRVDNGVLYNAVVDCRVIKSRQEIDLMKHINKISSQAHCWVMQNAQPGMREFQLESMFQHWGYFRGGCRHQSYASICGCGSNGSVLHYGHAGAPNDGLIKDGDMCLLDMGAEYKCYTSDITCTFPIAGRFTDDQKLIYEAVLAAQWGVMRQMKPGVSYIDMHTLSYRIICEKLLEGGLLKGNVDQMMRANIGAVFMPHGLGHFMGLDTHDVGGRPKGHPVQTLNGYKSLRCCITLRAGMVITVEPGIYFNDYSINKALANPEQAQFLNETVLNRFKGFGGVRIEDDVLITDTGIENLTQCPRTVEEVELVMAGKLDSSHNFTTYESSA